MTFNKVKFCQNILFTLLLPILLTILPVTLSAQTAEPQDPANVIKIGVLAKRGAEKAVQKWHATGQYLNKKIPEHQFKIIPLPFDDIPIIINNKMVDFVIANPAIYIDLSLRYKVRRVLTLKNKLLSDIQLSRFGSVIFVNQNNHEIYQLEHTISKRVAAVHPTSLGGWIMGLRELIDAGVDENKLASVEFLETHDAVVNAVLNNHADVGIVRTDTLERMANENKISLNAVRVLNNQKYSDFPFLISSRQYPEWPIAKLKHTTDKLAKKVAIALLSMQADDQAAIDANISGWTIPENYQTVHEILQQLEITPYENFHDISLKDLFNNYWYLLLIFLLLLLSFFYLAIRVQRLKKVSSQHKQELLISREQLRATFEQAAVGIAHASSNGRFIKINQHLSSITGYSVTELMKINFNDLLHPDELSEDIQLFDQLKQGETNYYSKQRRIFCKNDSVSWVQIALSCIRNDDGSIKYIVIIFDDINHLKHLETDLRKQLKYNELLLNIAGDGILGLDLQGHHSFVNPAAAEMLGYEVAELIGQNGHNIWHHTKADGSHYPEDECPIISVLADGIVYKGRNELFWRKDGSSFHVDYISNPIIVDNKITGAVLIFHKTHNNDSE